MASNACVAVALGKQLVLAGLALCGLACTAPAQTKVQAETLGGKEFSLSLTQSERSLTLTLSNSAEQWQQVNLLPLHHPLDERSPTHIKIQEVVNGFSLNVIYPVREFSEQIMVRFEFVPDDDQKVCPLRLTQFRREQRYAGSNELRSGLFADYKEGVATILGIEGRPVGAASMPVRLLAQDRSFCNLPSVLDFMPALNIPKVR